MAHQLEFESCHSSAARGQASGAQSGKAMYHSSVAGGWAGSELAKAWGANGCGVIQLALCKQSLNPIYEDQIL